MMRPKSLRTQLLAGILAPVLLLMAFHTASLYRQALDSVDTAYDRTLLASAKAIGELLEGRDRPISVRITEALGHAIELMARHDFTQLPVTEEQDKFVGVVSSDSILRAIDALGVQPAQLTVADAMTRNRDWVIRVRRSQTYMPLSAALRS